MLCRLMEGMISQDDYRGPLQFHWLAVVVASHRERCRSRLLLISSSTRIPYEDAEGKEEARKLD